VKVQARKKEVLEDWRRLTVQEGGERRECEKLSGGDSV
jgi:hypothetical protein